jgi:hypothetical protein
MVHMSHNSDHRGACLQLLLVLVIVIVDWRREGGEGVDEQVGFRVVGR